MGRFVTTLSVNGLRFRYFLRMLPQKYVFALMWGDLWGTFPWVRILFSTQSFMGFIAWIRKDLYAPRRGPLRPIWSTDPACRHQDRYHQTVIDLGKSAIPKQEIVL